MTSTRSRVTPSVGGVGETGLLRFGFGTAAVSLRQLEVFWPDGTHETRELEDSALGGYHVVARR